MSSAIRRGSCGVFDNPGESDAARASYTAAREKEALTRIAWVRVGVTVAGEGAKQDGLSEAALRAVLEEKVNGAGLRLSVDEKAPALSLVVNAQKYAAEGVYAVAVDLDLYQLVSLERAGHPPFHASTWRVTQVFLRPANELGSVRAVAERAAAAFVKDFRAANPRR